MSSSSSIQHSRSLTGTSSQINNSSVNGSYEDLKSREDAIRDEIEEIREMGSSIPEDEANAMILDLERKIANLRKGYKKKSKSKTVDLLKKRLANLEDKYNADVEALQEKIQEARKSMVECKKVIKDQESSLKNKNTQIAGLEMKLQNTSDEMEKLRTKIQEQKQLLKKNKSKRDNRHQLEKLACDQEKFIEKLSQDIEKLEKERLNFNSKLNFANASKTKLKDSNAELTQQLQDALDIEKELNLKLEDRDKTIQSMKEVISSELKDVSNHENTSPLDISLGELEEIETTTCESTSEILLARLGQLLKICSVLEQRERISQKVALDEINKLKTVINFLNEEISQISSLEKDLENKTEAFEELEKESKNDQEANAASVRAIQRVMTELSDSKDLEINGLKEEIASLKHENEVLIEKAESFKSGALGLLNADNQSDGHPNSTLVGIAASGVAASLVKKDNPNAKDFEIDQLENEIEQLHKENENLRKTMRKMKTSNGDNIHFEDDALRKANIEIDELDREIDLLHLENESLKKKLDALESRALDDTNDNGVSFYEKEIEDMEKEVQFLKNENATLKDRLAEPDKHDINVDETSDGPLKSDLEIENYDQKDDVPQNKNDCLKLDASTQFSVEETNISVDLEVETLTQKIEKLQNENDNLREQLCNLEPKKSQNRNDVENIPSQSIDEGRNESGIVTIENEQLLEETFMPKEDSLISNAGENNLCVQIENESHSDSVTADIDADHLRELTDLKKAMHESTEREIKLAREINRLNELLKVQDSSFMISQDESTVFGLLNETENTSGRPTLVVEQNEGSRILPIVSPSSSMIDSKLQDEVTKLNSELLDRDEELEAMRRRVFEVQETLDKEQNNSVHEKEAILKVLQTKNDALENAKKIIASLQHARTESLQILKADLNKKKEEINSLQFASDEEKKRSVTLQAEINSLKNLIAERDSAKSSEQEKQSKDLVSAAMAQISHAIQHSFHACIDAESESDKNPLDNDKIKIYRESTQFDKYGYPINERNSSQPIHNSKDEEKIIELEEEIKYLDSALDESNALINNLETTNFELNEQMDNIIIEKNKDIDELKEKIFQLENELKKSLTEMDALRSNHVAEVASCRADIRNMQMELKSSKQLEIEQPDETGLQPQINSVMSENESNKKALAVTEESLRNAKMIISSLEQSNKRIIDDFKTKLNESNKEFSNLSQSSSKKDEEIEKISDELKKLSSSRDMEIKSFEAELDKLREVITENDNTIMARDREIKRLKSYVKAKRNKSKDNGNATDDSMSVISVRSDGKRVRRVKRIKKKDDSYTTDESKSVVSVRSDGKRVRRVKRSEKGKKKSSDRSPSASGVPRSPRKTRKTKVLKSTEEVNEFEIIPSTSMLLADDDSDTYDEKKLMEQYMQKNNFIPNGTEDLKENECEI